MRRRRWPSACTPNPVQPDRRGRGGAGTAAGGQSGGGKKADDDVVDAEFEEVKDSK
jgi:hypothetical protein